MNYQEARAFLKEKECLGSVYGLEGIRELLKRLGNPQEQLSCVHIAGTNGKGSTLAFVSAIFIKSGYKTGTYTSPAVFGYEERIQVNGRWIPKDRVAELLSRIRMACEAMTAAGFSHPTVFEMETAMAFLYFQEEKCQLVCLECGLGGRLDATNIIGKPICCAFTSISRDHMKLLGDNLQAIAKEKAGILKMGCPAVSAMQQPEVETALRRAAETLDCPFQMVDKESLQLEAIESGGKEAFCQVQRFSYKAYRNMEISLLGFHQAENAALAIEITEAVRGAGYEIPEAALYQGLQCAKWPGRFSRVSESPPIFIDGAHNEDGAKKLAQIVKFYFTNWKICYIIGIFQDKEYEKILAETLAYANSVVTVTPPGSRGLSGALLAEKARAWCRDTQYAETYEKAVRLAKEKTESDGVIIAFGSLSYLGELTEVLNQ